MATTPDARPETLEGIYGNLCAKTGAQGARRQTLADVVQLAVEIAREGREGRKIGTLFVIGEPDAVLARSRPLVLDPLYGHAGELLHVARPDFRETVKELAQLDGAFVVHDDGTFLAAARYVDVDASNGENFAPGLGTRHAAASSISRETGATSVVVSQSSVVRVYARGEIRAEIIPELFLLKQSRFLREQREVRRYPEYGLTLAVAGETAPALPER